TLYEHTAVAPTFEYIEEEVERSQDVILLLGFWNNSGGTWCRVGGHYVTVAGVNSTGQMIAFSDPFLDVANPAANPTEHNDAANVSHDIYNVSVMNIPQLGGNVAQITDYPVNVTDVYQNFAGQNVPDGLEPYQCPSEVPDVAVVEYAVIVSPMMPPKPFLIYGWVKYSNGTEVLNPKNMTITNLRTSENYMVETNGSYSYYQVIITSSCNVSAYDVLNFSADDGVNSTDPYEVMVTPGDMTEGGLFEQNLTIPLGAPDLVISDVWVCWPDNCTICYNITNIGVGPAGANHNTTLYVNGNEKAHDHVDEILLPGETYTRCFDGYSWTYSGVLGNGWEMAKDNITVCADSNHVITEENEFNNSLTEEWMCGDCDFYHEGVVDIFDKWAVVNYYVFHKPVRNDWAADCDIYHKGVIDIFDKWAIVNNYVFHKPLNCYCQT
ncbi:MAG: hypothetical protein DRP08_03420, partial [Candidatus Aenigmatarchaeota archaeon]